MNFEHDMITVGELQGSGGDRATESFWSAEWGSLGTTEPLATKP